LLEEPASEQVLLKPAAGNGNGPPKRAILTLSFLGGGLRQQVPELTEKLYPFLRLRSNYQQIWNAHLHAVFPSLPLPLTVAAGRKMLYDDMEALRGFRNRIAHHDPIFAYPLAEHHDHIKRLVNLRCRDTQQWFAQWEVVSATMGARRSFKLTQS